MNADRNLLMGLVALEMNLIDRDELVATMRCWIDDKQRPVDQILLEKTKITADDCAQLICRVEMRLAEGSGFAETLPPGAMELARTALHRLNDPELDANLTQAHGAPRNAPSQCPSGDPQSQETSRFRVLRPHAKGGLGEVFVAEDQELHREVALKEILPRHADNPDNRSRFINEAEITGALEHPGIVPVYGLGSHADGRPFYAMKLIRGESFQSAIERYHRTDRDRGDSAARAAEFRGLLARFVSVCDAMEYAHSRGVVHRDIKPSNIMLGKFAETLVVDWGLAKLIGRPDPLYQADETPLKPSSLSGSTPTEMGSTVGTPQYMSPEQASGELNRVGPASDVYSLGATLYCLMTGRPPFDTAQSGELAALLQSVKDGQFPPPRAVANVPRPLEAICLKAMANSPQDRYASPRGLAEDIESWRADEPVAAYRESGSQKIARWMRHHRTATRAAALSLLAIALVTVGAVLQVNRHRYEAELQAAEAKAARVTQQTQHYFELLNRAREGNSLRRGGWTWRGLAALGDASKIATASRDPVELRTEVAECLAGSDLREVGTLAEGVNPYCLAFSPDGRQLAVGDSRSLALISVSVYDVQSRKKLETLQFTSSLKAMWAAKKPDGVASIAFSRDGRWLLVGSRSGAIHAWDRSASPAKHVTWQAHEAPIESLAVARSPDVLFSASNIGEIKSWQIPSNGTALATWNAGEGINLSLSPDGQTIVCGMTTLLRLKSENLQPSENWIEPVPRSRRVCYSPDGLLMAVHFEVSGELGLINAKTGAVVRRLVDPELGVAHDGGVYNIDFSPDGGLMVTAASDGRLKLWDVAAGELVGSVPLDGILYPVFQPHGRLLATAANQGVVILEIGGSREQTVIAHQPNRIRAIDVAAEAAQLVCAAQVGDGPNGSITYWDLDGGCRLSEMPVAEKVTNGSEVALEHAAGLVALSCPGRGITLWRMGESAACARQDVADPYGLSFSPDHRKLWGGIVGTESFAGSPRVGRVVSWSLPDLKVSSEWANNLAALKEGVSLISCLMAGEKWVAAGSNDETIKLFDAQTGQQMTTFAGAGGKIQCIAISPVGDTIVAGTGRGGLTLVNIASKKAVHIENAHRDQVTSVAFARDGRLLASASKDRTIRLWLVRPKTLEALMTLRPAFGQITSVRFDSTASRLVYLTLNETAVRVWNLDLLRRRLSELGLDWE